MRMWTSVAPAWRSISMSFLEVLPRTMESSITTRRLPEMTLGSGFNFRRMPSWRMACVGWMNVRPT